MPNEPLRLAAGLLVLLGAGCGGAPEPPAGTGAEQTARAFYDALLRQDWGAGYTLLDRESRARCSLERFTTMARNFRRGLGFEPEAVRVRSCEEHDGEAIAQVVLTGQAGGHQRSYRDGLVLRRAETGWAVLLPPRFGHGRS